MVVERPRRLVRHHAVHDPPSAAYRWSQEMLAARRGISSHTTHAARRKARIMSNISRRTISRIGAEIDRIGRRLNNTTNERIDELRDEVVRQGDRVLDRVVEFEIRSRRDMVYAGDQQAGRESNEFAGNHLRGARSCYGREETLRYAVSQARTGGMALEFGVATGETLRMIVEERGGGQIYGFDSFQGLPEAWLPGMPAGTFAQEDLPEVGGAQLVVGLFDDVLPAFLEEHPGPVDFLHVDSDLYGSAKTVLELVGPRLRTGSVVHFDEFFNYPGWQRYEHRAWNEYVEETGLGYTYIAFAYNDCQVAARVDTPPSTTSALGAKGAQVAAGDQPLSPAADGS